MSAQDRPNHADDVDEEAAAYEEPSSDNLLPPADFKPFFTLVEDPDTGEYHHPAVHYIFADDDLDHFTTAVLEATVTEAGGGGFEERIVVLDLARDGSSVCKASSLSPHWQALKASVGQAPTWGSAPSGSERKLLKITGCRRYPTDSTARDLDAMADQFSRRLVELEHALRGEEQDPSGVSKT